MKQLAPFCFTVLILVLWMNTLPGQIANKPGKSIVSEAWLSPQVTLQPDSFYLIIRPDTVLIKQMAILNTGTDTLDFTIINNPQPEKHAIKGERSVEGSTLTCDQSTYIPGETFDFNFSLYNGSPDNEWLDTLEVYFPEGVNVNFATNFVGGTLGPLVYDGTTGNGITVHWNDENPQNGGNILPFESAMALVNLSFDQSLDDTLQIIYRISGDVNNAPPHDITDTLYFAPENVWLITEPETGVIPPGSEQIIDLYFNSGGLPIGNYLRHFVVESNDTANPQIEVPVNLIVFPYSLTQTINIPQGWSGISSYVIPYHPELEDIFDTVSDRVTVVRNQQGIYWPQAQINTIGEWKTEGYVINAKEPIQIKVNGLFELSQSASLKAGWNILPVVSAQPASTFLVFRDLDEIIDIVQEVGGDKVYWPSQNVYTLTQLMPGRAYYIRVKEDCLVVFPPPVSAD